MKTPAVVFLLFVSIFLAARADLTIVSDIKSKDIQASQMGNMTMKLSNGKVRVDAGPAHIIMLSAEKKMLIIVDAQKMIMVKNLNDPSGSASGESEKPAIERTGKTETINGYDCQQILLKDKKGRISELWVSSAAPDMKEFASSFKALASANPRKSDYDWTGVMNEKDLNTYPIRVIRYGADGTEETRITVLSIKKDAIPASEFTAPAGYMEMAMPDFGGLGGTDIAPSSSSPAPASATQPIQDMTKKLQQQQGQ